MGTRDGRDERETGLSDTVDDALAARRPSVPGRPARLGWWNWLQCDTTNESAELRAVSCELRAVKTFASGLSRLGQMTACTLNIKGGRGIVVMIVMM